MSSRARWAHRVVALFILGLACSFSAQANTASNAARANDAQASVIGGFQAPANSFNWLAYIVSYGKTESSACTGSVVSPNVVLTAGHCVVDTDTGIKRPSSSFEVTTGAVDHTSRQAQTTGVKEVVVNPTYDIATGHGDAALLVLSRKTKAPAIPLATPSDSDLFDAATLIVFAGWGQTDPSSLNLPKTLRYGTATIQRSDYCAAQLTYYPFFDPSIQFCSIDTSQYNAGPCHGDSGGPALTSGTDKITVQVGIANIAAPGCATDRPAGFARVDPLVGWIASVIERVRPIPLPRMSLDAALAYAKEGLQVDFAAHFRGRRFLNLRCGRLSRSKFDCPVSWSKGPSSYYGRVTVFYLWRGKKVVWDERFTIHWVNTRCYFDSGHPKKCPVRTSRR